MFAQVARVRVLLFCYCLVCRGHGPHPFWSLQALGTQGVATALSVGFSCACGRTWISPIVRAEPFVPAVALGFRVVFSVRGLAGACARSGKTQVGLRSCPAGGVAGKSPKDSPSAVNFRAPHAEKNRGCHCLCGRRISKRVYSPGGPGRSARINYQVYMWRGDVYV